MFFSSICVSIKTIIHINININKCESIHSLAFNIKALLRNYFAKLKRLSVSRDKLSFEISFHEFHGNFNYFCCFLSKI